MLYNYPLLSHLPTRAEGWTSSCPSTFKSTFRSNDTDSPNADSLETADFPDCGPIKEDPRQTLSAGIWYLHLQIPPRWYSQERGYLTECWTGPEAGYSYPRKKTMGLHQKHANKQFDGSTGAPSAAKKVLSALERGRMSKLYRLLFTEVPTTCSVKESRTKRLTPNMHIGWVGLSEYGSHCPPSSRGGPQLGRPVDGYSVVSGAGNLNIEGGRGLLWSHSGHQLGPAPLMNKLFLSIAEPYPERCNWIPRQRVVYLPAGGNIDVGVEC